MFHFNRPQFNLRARRPAKGEQIQQQFIHRFRSPADSLGGIPAIYAHKHGIPIVAVRENRTILSVSGQKLGFNVIEVDNYVEAAGVLLAVKNGIHLESVRRPLPTLRHGLGRGAAAKKNYRVRSA